MMHTTSQSPAAAQDATSTTERRIPPRLSSLTTEKTVSFDNEARDHHEDFEDLDSLDDLRPSEEEEKGLLAGEHRELRDLEAAAPPPSPVNHKDEFHTTSQRKYTFLALYFASNLSLTLYNKAVLGHFAFPWLLTTIHASSVSIGCLIMLKRGHFQLSQLSKHEHMVLVAFSILFTVNIAMSNVSLALVSVPFHQIMRSTCPVVTVLIYRLYYNRTYSTYTYLSLLVLILGVGFTTYGDYYFSLLGFVLTASGVILASLKTITTNRLLTGNLKLPVFELLLRMSPLAAAQSLLYAILTGEASKAVHAVSAGQITFITCIALIGNGFLAFILNIVSFQTNKVAGALTMAVCGNLKQTLTVLLGIVLFHLQVSVWNGVGMLITMGGAAWYSKVELENKRKRRPTENDISAIPPQSWHRSLRDFAQRCLGGHVLTIILALTLFGIMVVMTDVASDPHHFQNGVSSALSKALEFRILIPATQSNFHLCQLMLSIGVLGYPTPTLINWGANATIPHVAKIDAMKSYLEDVDNEEDLVLIIDGYDIWFQLPPEVMLERYYAANKAANQRLIDMYGPAAVQSLDMKQTVIFAGDKLCWPHNTRRPACWAVMDSTLPEDAFGPETDRGDMVHDRPKWLNSGVMMGPVKDVREVFVAFAKTLNETYDENSNVRNSDQMYLSDVLGKQEFARYLAGHPDEVFHTDERPWSERDFPDLVEGEKTEYHIGIDYDGSLFQTNAGYEQYITWLPYNSSLPVEYDVDFALDGPAQPGLPDDLANGPPPRDPSSAHVSSLSALKSPSSGLSWADMSLGTNIISNAIFPLIHFTGQKHFRDLWWERMWFIPQARELLAAASVGPTQHLTKSIAGKKFFWPTRPDDMVMNGAVVDAPAGSAYSDGGLVLPWGRLCYDSEPELFGAKIRHVEHPDFIPADPLRNGGWEPEPAMFEEEDDDVFDMEADMERESKFNKGKVIPIGGSDAPPASQSPPSPPGSASKPAKGKAQAGAPVPPPHLPWPRPPHSAPPQPATPPPPPVTIRPSKGSAGVAQEQTADTVHQPFLPPPMSPHQSSGTNGKAPPVPVSPVS